MHIAGLSRHEAEQFKSRIGILQTEIDVDNTSKEGNSLQVIYSYIYILSTQYTDC